MGIEKEYDENKSIVDEAVKEIASKKEKVALEDSVHLDETLSFKTSEANGDSPTDKQVVTGYGEDQKSEADKIASALETIACAAHMANRAYCIATGDKSQPVWEETPEWQKSSCRNGVRAILLNPDTTPEQSHEGWLKQKTEEGWKYGAVKDVEKKEHPCFLPYGELSELQRAKDVIFGETIRSMAKVHGSLGGTR